MPQRCMIWQSSLELPTEQEAAAAVRRVQAIFATTLSHWACDALRLRRRWPNVMTCQWQVSHRKSFARQGQAA